MRSVIVDWKRSPFTKAHKGPLSIIRPDEFGGQVVRELIAEVNFEPSKIEDIIVGCAYPEGEQGYNIGRLMSFLGGLPPEVPGSTVNRLCGSSMQAILNASTQISAGWGDCFLCGGVESMSRVKRRGFNWSTHPSLDADYPQAYINMGITAENVAELYDISREEQEEYALSSHSKAAKAVSDGLFSREIAPITYGANQVSSDDCIRKDSSIESMARLKPAFDESGSVTAATSSPLTDGAVFSIICSEEFAMAHNLEPLAVIVAGAVTGCPPELMGLGPISSTKLALERAGWGIEDIEVFELNEAFSAQTIACLRELNLDPEIVNMDGGALSIGHPLGASGARIACKAASIMKREGKKRSMASMCIGGGMGISIALESI